MQGRNFKSAARVGDGEVREMAGLEYIDPRGLANRLDEAETDPDGRRLIAVLWGAGCSYTANIPLAGGIVDKIKQHPTFCRAYNRFKRRTTDREPIYAELMEELPEEERRNLIREAVTEGKINWAHLLLADLIRRKYVKRVVTTNFDTLLAKSCALMGIDISIYDFAAAPRYIPERIVDPCVFHLHGLHYGFFPKNTRGETEEMAVAAQDLFEDTRKKKYLWIVIGYSGINDELFDKFLDIAGYGKIYWCYLKGALEESVLAHLEDYKAIGVQIEGADQLLLEITRHLDCFPPQIFCQPFTHFSSILWEHGSLKMFPTREQLTASPHGILKAEIDGIENSDVMQNIRKLLETPEADVQGLLKNVEALGHERLGNSWLSDFAVWLCVQARKRLCETAEALREEKKLLADDDADSAERAQKSQHLDQEWQNLNALADRCWEAARAIDGTNPLCQISVPFPGLPPDAFWQTV